ncbi:hypothetical protein J4G33_05505 [Actinotalea sp. BY-33]|uniref:Uncharacterized protein n=1 Tax=Actinotalea soli TaxID=2819234 RepID=A0A939RTJ0_9CELL|nr:hypothetical protein [Actinotalea soli]MBO1751254.1 hypothetical protein [Actinotalea soli]
MATETTGPVDDGTTDWGTAWEEALGALELDVDAAEAMLALDHLADLPAHDPWSPPVHMGPLPVTLVERAKAVLDRQIEVGRRLAEAADLSRRHSRAAQTLRSAPPSSPVYLDTPA